MTLNDITNYLELSPNLSTSGQPTADQFRALATSGFTHVINLATSDSSSALPGKAELLDELGLTYVHIPVVWDNPQPADFAAFEAAMAALPEDGRTLIHCIANYRVTGFYSVYAQTHLGWTAEEAAALRARVWQTADYPIWQQFLEQTAAALSDRT